MKCRVCGCEEPGWENVYAQTGDEEYVIVRVDVPGTHRTLTLYVCPSCGTVRAE
jgi:uncharacterized Zn finger protein